MSDNQEQQNGSEDRIDEIARKAGAALRRPTPGDGMARVRSSRRRRRTVQAVAGGSTVVVLAIGLFVAINRSSGDSTVVTDSGPDTVAPATVVPGAGSTATSPSESGWVPSDDAFPDLAYIACCGTNFAGDPSPAVPDDPADPLPAGIYNVRYLADDQPADDFTNGTLTLEIRPYVRCDELADFECSGTTLNGVNDLGVPTDAARAIDLALDDTLRVGLHGFGCDGDELLLDRQAGTGTDAARLFVELDESYETAVAEPLRSGVAPEEVAADLVANRTAGFFDPGCPFSTKFAWTPSSGPTILARLYLDTVEGVPPVDPVPSASASWITPTAVEVDDNGDYTLYLYAGFLS